MRDDVSGCHTGHQGAGRRDDENLRRVIDDDWARQVVVAMDECIRDRFSNSEGREVLNMDLLPVGQRIRRELDFVEPG